MGSGQDLDRFGELRVPRYGSVLVSVGADQVGQHPSIARI